MIKVNDKILNDFLNIMDEYGEFVFGDEEEIKNQLQMLLNTQGYWSGSSIRVYYNNETKEFYVESRF